LRAGGLFGPPLLEQPVPELETGLPGARHFYDMKEQAIQPHAADDAASARLWAESEKLLAGLGY